MRIIKTVTASALACFALTACQPTMFGMPESQFKQLSPEEKQEVIRSYNERKMEETRNAPLRDAINVFSQGLKSKHTHKKIPLSSKSNSHCHWEGDTRVCKSKSSSSSINVGF